MAIRAMAAAAGVAVAVTLLSAAPAWARPDVRGFRLSGPCALDRTPGESVRAFSKRQIRCAADRWSVPGGATKAICIAKRESGLIPTARSATGKFLGLFQQSRRYWPGNFSAYSRRSWHLKATALNGRSNAVVTVRMAHDPGVGWRPWAGTGC